MADHLDDLFGRLAGAPADRSLDALEASVMSGIARRRAERRTVSSLGPVQAAMVGLALAIGVAAGGAAGVSIASEPAASEPVAGMNLAPSTLLLASR